MKKTRILLLAYVAVLSVGAISCSKENNDSGNAGNMGGDAVPDGWVDLGLPSGLLWAKCNIGATTPEDYGNYYSWGETTTKDLFTWSTYRYCTVDSDGNLQTLTKYNTNSYYGSVDNLITLQAMDDAATAALGNGARTPTAEEWRELINNTTVEWITMNGINGRMFTGTNGNTIFLPAAGGRLGSGLYPAGRYGVYWSSSLYDEYFPAKAWYFYFSSSNQLMDYYGYRSGGQSVRPVRSAK